MDVKAVAATARDAEQAASEIAAWEVREDEGLRSSL